MNFIKKTGHVLFCFVPVLLAVGIQFLISVPITGIGAAYILCTAENNIDFLGFYNSLMQLLSSSSFNTMLSASYGVSALIIFALWYKKRFHPNETCTISRQFHPLIVVGIIAIAIGLQYVVNYVVTFTAYLQPGWLRTYEKLLETIDMSHVTFLLALYSVIIAPISEELIFRGVTLSYAKKEMPFWLANTLQAALFGIFHMNPLQGIYAFFIGLFLGYICHRGGSILLSILLHAVFNLWGTFVPDFFMYGSDQVFFFCFWLILGTAVLCVGLQLFKKGVLIRNKTVNNFPPSSDI